ncbi:hypothetical protein AB0K04_16810 [Micromonospora coxensis]|uniref:hypothetical protein n=1 Tax=Micromonospora coxensis TaxID=356852 RepID=UPI003420C6D8
MSTILPARREDRTRRGTPRIALLAAAVLAVPAFLVGPSASGPGDTTPAAAVASAPGALPGTSAPVAAPGTAAPATDATTDRTSTATAPSRAGTSAPSPTSGSTSDETAAGLTTEQTRYRSARITQSPRRPACGGALALGTVRTCASIVDQQEHRWTVTTTADRDVLLTQLGRSSGLDMYSVGGRLTDAAGQEICRIGIDAGSCRLGPAGTYTITVKLPYPTGRGNYTIAVESTRTPSTCATIPAELFHFGAAGLTRTLPAGAAAQCHQFDQPLDALARIVLKGPGDLRGQILDAQHEKLCGDFFDGAECRLGRPGPYRLFTWEQYGKESAHTVTARRLSDPAGCQALPLAPFGDPGAAAGSGATPPDDQTCHTFTTDAPRPALLRPVSDDGTTFGWAVLDHTGVQVCSGSTSSGVPICDLPAAGRYTLLVSGPQYSDRTHHYRMAVTPLDRTDGCAPTTGYAAWDQPGLTVRQTSPVQTNCQPFEGRAGDRIAPYIMSWHRLVDRTGTLICTEPSDEVGCVLPADGTYRLISYLASWDAGSTEETYRMAVRRLSDPVGCPTVRPGEYNAAPSGAPNTVPCQILEIPSAGTYRVKALHGDNLHAYARVLDTAGRTVCGDVRCEFPAAGRYTLFPTEGGLAGDAEYRVSLLPIRPTGCTPVSDAGWRDAPHRGEITVSGQVDCLALPTPSGAGLAALLPTDLAMNIEVVDAEGDPVCSLTSYRWYNCRLDGPAPYSVLLTGGNWVTQLPYTLGFARVDAPACPVLPRDATGVTVTAGADRIAACFSIPADHAARESITWTRTSGTGRARLQVYDSQGWSRCGVADRTAQGTLTCDLPAGPVTVLLQTDGYAATYQLTRRDAGTP